MLVDLTRSWRGTAKRLHLVWHIGLRLHRRLRSRSQKMPRCRSRHSDLPILRGGTAFITLLISHFLPFSVGLKPCACNIFSSSDRSLLSYPVSCVWYTGCI